MKFTFPKIYPITDKKLSGLTHAEQVAQFVEVGATLIQLRDKESSPREFYEDAVKAVAIAREHGAHILINDRVDIALITGADGVHLGQDDLPVIEARRQLGKNAIIGFSTHNIEQVRLVVAEELADYVAFGPVFSTTTKSNLEPVVGLDGLRNVRKLVQNIPLIAIGGINHENISSVFDAGADSVAIIGTFYDDGANIRSKYERLANIVS